MEKIYILTCVNENSDVVCVKTFKTRDEARDEMKGHYDAELRNAIESGYKNVDDNYFNGVKQLDTASLLYGSTQYKWAVTECYDPVAEEAISNFRKRQYVNQLYLYIDEKLDGGKIQILDEPVNGYNSFYVDNSGAIMVWNTDKKNYTEITNIPVDIAFELACLIEEEAYKPE